MTESLRTKKASHCHRAPAFRNGSVVFNEKHHQFNSVALFLSISKLEPKKSKKSTTLTEKIGTAEDNKYQLIQCMTLNKVVDFERRTSSLLKVYLN
jgi:hypothetical protein